MQVINVITYEEFLEKRKDYPRYIISKYDNPTLYDLGFIYQNRFIPIQFSEKALKDFFIQNKYK